ncbi:MAG: ABC transporter substrate-binding protein [Verrucomicrobia bacterium]|nr:ABC transporter substrate-binding protein [Verrucomicrobiota bacterium]
MWVCAGIGTGFAAEAEKRLKVVATTTMVADLARDLGGDRVDVAGLMGPGVDPHLYKATAGDLRRMQRADLILYNGLHLEGKLQEAIERSTGSGRKIKAVTDRIPKDRLLEAEGAVDPHVWFDVSLWILCAEAATEAFKELDPAGSPYYEERLQSVRARLTALHEWCKAQAKDVSPEQRILITSHDAFSYFGRAYGFKVIGLQGISTVTEAGLADVTRLTDFVKTNKVKAVFVETSVSPAAMRRIQKDSGARLGGELFSDATGSRGEMKDGYDLGTVEGMIRHNMNTIVRALK